MEHTKLREKFILRLAVVLAMLCGLPVNAQEDDSVNITMDNVDQLQILFEINLVDMTDIKWSLNGEYLAVASKSDVTIFETSSFTPLTIVQGEFVLDQEFYDTEITDIEFNSESTQLAIASTTGEINVWDLSSNEMVNYFSNSTGLPIWDIEWSPMGDFMVVGSSRYSNSGSQIIWYVETMQTIILSDNVNNSDNEIAISSTGLIASAETLDNNIILRAMDNLSNERILGNHEHWISDMEFSPQGDILFSSGWDGTIRVWDIETQKQIHIFTHTDASLNSIAVSSQADLVVAGTGYNAEVDSIIFWDYENDEYFQISIENAVNKVELNPENDLLALSTVGGTVTVWGVLLGT